MRPRIFALFHKERQEVIDSLKYFGNKETALNAAMDHVAFMRLVMMEAADDDYAKLCCVTFSFGDDT